MYKIGAWVIHKPTGTKSKVVMRNQTYDPICDKTYNCYLLERDDGAQVLANDRQVRSLDTK